MVYRTKSRFSAIFGPIGILVNGIGLYLLLKMRNSRMDFTQRCILTNICLFDLFSSIATTILGVEMCLNTRLKHDFTFVNRAGMIFYAGSYYATLWLVLDRYLHLKLNIKYVLYFSQKKLLISMIILWTVSILSGCLSPPYDKKCKVAKVIIFLEVLMIIFSAFVYGKGILLSRKMRKSHFKKHILKGLSLTVIILLAFIVCFTLPDILFANFCFDGYRIATTWSYKIAELYDEISHAVSMWIDALIYIFFCPEALRLFRSTKFRMSEHTRSTIRIIKSYKSILLQIYQSKESVTLLYINKIIV